MRAKALSLAIEPCFLLGLGGWSAGLGPLLGGVEVGHLLSMLTLLSSPWLIHPSHSYLMLVLLLSLARDDSEVILSHSGDLCDSVCDTQLHG